VTQRPSDGRIAAVFRRLDLLSRVGARALRAVAVVDVAIVVLFWLFVGRAWDEAGAVLSVLALVPAGWLWWYARSLAGAVDAAKIELGVRYLIAKTGRSVSEVLESRRHRYAFLRAGWRAIRAARDLKGDLDRLGVDVTAFAVIANPGSLLLTGASILASGAIGVLAAVAILLKLVV
jgi:hypothetical protein